MKNKWLLLVLMIISMSAPVHALTLISPDDNFITGNASLQLTFQHQFNSTNFSCDVLIDNQSQGMPYNLSEQIFAFDTVFTEGLHTWSIACINDNITIESETRSITLDTSSPNISILSPLATTYGTNNITFHLNVTDVFPAVDCQMHLASSSYNTDENMQLQTNTLYSSTKTLPNGQYALTLLCTDQLGNSNQQGVNFTVNKIEPLFDVVFEKNVYTMGEAIAFDIRANNGSNVFLTITAPNGNSYVWNYNGQNYPKHEVLPYSKRYGSYNVIGNMQYLNYSLSVNKNINVQSNMDVEIKGKTTINLSEKLTLEGIPSGGFGTLNLSWKLSNGSTVKSHILERTYATSGKYTETFIVVDQEGNELKKDVEVSVKQAYRLYVYVIDGSSKLPIKDALLEIDDDEYLTNSDGLVSLDLLEDSYDMTISKEDYKPYSDSFSFHENRTLNISLNLVDKTPPSITLMTTPDEILTEPKALTFSANDVGLMQCSLYLKRPEESWSVLTQTLPNIQANKVYQFNVENITAGSYQWKVECKDSNNNGAFSEERSFSVNSEELLNTIQENEDAIAGFTAALETFNTLDKDEREAFETLNIKEHIEETQKQMERIKRDMNNLIFRNDLTNEEKEQERKILLEKMQEIQQNTPISITVKDSKTFVKYPTVEEVERLLLAVLGNDANKKLLKKNQALQQSLSTATKAKIVEISYPSKTETVTLIEKQIALESTESGFLAEYIPLAIAQAKEITILNEDYQILGDSLIRFSTGNVIAYTIPKAINLELAQETTTIFVTKEQTGSTPTGFSIKTVSNSPYSLGILIAIGVLLGGFVAVKRLKRKDEQPLSKKPGVQEAEQSQNTTQQGTVQSLWTTVSKVLPQKTENPQFLQLITLMYQHIGTGDYQQALSLYQLMKTEYAKLPHKQQHKHYGELVHICTSIDVLYARKLADDVTVHLANFKRKEALESFNVFAGIFQRLSETGKNELYEKYAYLSSQIETIRTSIMMELQSKA
ncbi:hypothetical protein C4573_00130 [Candidatus Woesearchaeota archaeon]|nr:MAG: hypothetical protein C4573_00130 [Candidatus Woesearchaeota archaeon]